MAGDLRLPLLRCNAIGGRPAPATPRHLWRWSDGRREIAGERALRFAVARYAQDEGGAHFGRRAHRDRPAVRGRHLLRDVEAQAEATFRAAGAAAEWLEEHRQQRFVDRLPV